MGLGEFANKFEYALRMSCIANGYLENINDLNLIDNLVTSNDFSFKLDKKEDIAESFKKVVEYTNLFLQTYPTILDMNYQFDETNEEATIKHLQDFQTLLWIKTIVSDCHYHLMIVAPSTLIFKQKIKEFTDKNLKAKLEKNKITTRELLIEEEKFKLLSSGILRDKKFIKKSAKLFKLVSKLTKKNKLFLKNTKNNDIELIKKHITPEEISKVIMSNNQMSFSDIYVHSMSSQKVDENPGKYQSRLAMFNNQEETSFKNKTQIEKIEDAMYGVLYYAVCMMPTLDELFYYLVHNNYLNNFSVPYKIRTEEQVQYLINYLKEDRAKNLDEAVEIYQKEVGPAYERILLADMFDEELKQAKAFLESLEHSKKQEIYLESKRAVDANKSIIDKEIENFTATVNKNINKIGKLNYVKGISKKIPHKGLVDPKDLK